MPNILMSDISRMYNATRLEFHNFHNTLLYYSRYRNNIWNILLYSNWKSWVIIMIEFYWVTYLFGTSKLYILVRCSFVVLSFIYSCNWHNTSIQSTRQRKVFPKFIKDNIITYCFLWSVKIFHVTHDHNWLVLNVHHS